MKNQDPLLGKDGAGVSEPHHHHHSHQQAIGSGEKPPTKDDQDHQSSKKMGEKKPESADSGIGIQPVPAQGSTATTSIEKFLACNPKLDVIKAQRDSAIGWMKYINALIFGFLLFSPALAVIPRMKAPWIMAVLWTMIGLILWTYLEYQARSELWFICLCRGVVIDFHKTDTPMKWITQKPMFFAYSFILLFVLATYYGLEAPDFDFDNLEHFWTAMLQAVALLFVIFMSKSVVDLEGSNWLLTPNLMLTYFQDPQMLEAKGFTLVHVTNLKKLVGGVSLAELGSIATAGLLPGGAPKKPFSWNEVHALDHVADQEVSFSLVDGLRLVRKLIPLKDVDQ